MATKVSSDTGVLVDGSFDFSGGVDSSKTTTLQSDLNPNGIRRDQLIWANNATLRTIGISQRTGWQPLVRIMDAGGRWQGGFIYEPDNANPYLVCSISGVIYIVLLEAPYTITDLSAAFGLYNPPDAEIAFFVQGENQLIIQAGDYYNPGTPVPGTTDASGRTLPLFWNGTTLRRSIGITTPAPTITPGQNEIPAATCMDYYGNRIWYAQARAISGSDMVGALSGTLAQRYRDAILNVTENPLCFSGDGFTVPTNAGNIRAIKHSANLNAALGQGQLYVFTRKVIYQFTVPTTRTDWINADPNNQPRMDVVQLVNGAVGDRCVVPVNGDLFYQSFEPSVRSLIRAVSNFGEGQWGNTSISQNEERALQFNDRSLMRFSSGVEFNNRVLHAVLPVLAADGTNVIHQGILPLDFDIVTNLEGKKPPVWEGIWDGAQILQLFTGDFGGRQRAFYTNISDEDGSLNVWEMTVSDRFQNGDNRITWGAEFPAYTWASSGYEYRLKQLNGGELWIDKLLGTTDITMYYRADAEPCWRFWWRKTVCNQRCEEEDAVLTGYPCVQNREGYVFTIAFPEPEAVCNQMGVRPTTHGYQFQTKIVIKGWCRIRGLLLYALPVQKPQFQGLACPANPAPGAMNTIPDFVPARLGALPTPTPPTPPTPVNPPTKATIVSPANGDTSADPEATILSWADGGGASSYNVYLNGVLQGNQTDTTFDPGSLTSFAAYTWRIDSVNSGGTTTGDTWTFTTTGHATVVAWAARVVANGGAAPSVATKQILHVFCVGLDNNSLTASMISVNCFVTDNLMAALTPLIRVSGNDPWTNNNFVTGDLSVDGLKGNGSTKYLDSGIVPSVAFAADTNSVGISLYNSFSSADGGSDICTFGDPFKLLQLQACTAANKNEFFCYGQSTGFLEESALAGGVGFTSGNRTAANAIAIYTATSGGFNTAGTGAGAPETLGIADACFVYVANNHGVPFAGTYSPKRYSFLAFHKGLNATQAQNLFNLVQAMRTSFGGGFV